MAARVAPDRRPRSRATAIWSRVGSTPTTVGAERGGPPGEPGLRRTRRRARGGTGEVALDQREDLLLVLGVSAVGELLLPPPGVLFPQRFLRAHRSILAGRRGGRRRSRAQRPHPPSRRPTAQCGRDVHPATRRAAAHRRGLGTGLSTTSATGRPRTRARSAAAHTRRSAVRPTFPRASRSSLTKYRIGAPRAIDHTGRSR